MGETSGWNDLEIGIVKICAPLYFYRFGITGESGGRLCLFSGFNL